MWKTGSEIDNMRLSGLYKALAEYVKHKISGGLPGHQGLNRDFQFLYVFAPEFNSALNDSWKHFQTILWEL